MDNVDNDDKVKHSLAQKKDEQQSTLFEIGEISIPIGTKDDGEIFSQDISHIPGCLICGFSGTGKTTFIRTAITYLATHYPSEKVKFIFYDSKGVDYNEFNALPHCLIPVVTDDKKVNGVISWVSAECEGRLKKLAALSVKDIYSYNKLCDVAVHEGLPHLFVFLDDFSVIQLNNEKKISLLDVLQNGRAIGIHIVLVTSSISYKGFPKEILSAVTCRVSFCVTTKTESKAAIGQTGAENLFAPGELIFKWQNKLVKCQGVYLSDEDIQKSIKKIQRDSGKNVGVSRSTITQFFDSVVMEQSEFAGEDELFDAAVEAVFENGKASTGNVQRRLRVGFNRASRLLDTMEKQGIVGPEEGTKPRQILISKDQWQTIRNKDKTNMGHIGTNTDGESESDITLQDFALFNIGNFGLSINDNQIQVSNKVKTNYDPEICTLSFNGNSVAGLIYKKPRLFSRGYIEFVMKPDVKITNPIPHIMTITRDDLADILHVEFDKNAEHIIKTFMTQISQDISIPLKEL